LLRQAGERLTKAKEKMEDVEEARRMRKQRSDARLAAKEEATRKEKEAEELRVQELASLAENDMKVLREEMVHWKPLSRSASGMGGSSGGGGGGAERGGEKEKRTPRKKKTKRREEMDEVDDLQISAKMIKKDEAEGVRRSTKASAKASVKKAMVEEEDDDDDDDLEDWQKARMNPKLSSLVQSKRTREDRDKNRYSKRRRDDDDLLDLPPPYVED
jgi:hypothetical protein